MDTIKQLRLPLIVLITFAHSYSGVRVGYTLWGDGWDTYEVLKIVVSQTLCKVAMPTFFVMSGYLFFANVTEWNVKTYLGKLRRRVKTLLIPYIVWNLLMAIKLKTFSLNIFWAFWYEAGKQIDWFGNEQLMTAPANMPLWFLRDLMVVALLSPIIYIGIRKMGGWLLIILTPLYLSGVCAFIPGLSAYAVYFFTLGAFLGIRKMDIVETCMKFEKPSYTLAIIFGLAMICTFRTPVFSSLMLCFRLAGVVAVFCLANRIMGTVLMIQFRKEMVSRRTVPMILQMVCDASYFVYLAHYVFFFAFIDTAFFSLFGTSTPSMCIHYLACPLLKAAILVGLYMLYRFVVNSVKMRKG